MTPLAKPDTDDGWLKYAHELDAALACADWSKGARIVLKEVFAQIFGPAKRRIAQLSPSELARRYGAEKSNIVRATRELVSGCALVRVNHGWYRFNKNYEEWTRNGHSRLSPAEIKWAKDAPQIAMSYKNISGDKSDTRAETDLISMETSLTPRPVSDLSPNGDKSDTGAETDLTPAPLIEDSRTLSIENLIKNREGEGEPRPRTLAALGPEYKRVGDLAMELTAELSWGKWVLERGIFGDSAIDIEAAIKEASGVGKLDKGYVAKILARWAREGRPKHVNGKPIVIAKTPDQLAADRAEIDRMDKEKAKLWSRPHGGAK